MIFRILPGVALTLALATRAVPVSAGLPNVGEWMEVPNSKLAAVLPSPLPDVGYGGPRAIMSAWSGGAFDTRRNQLLVWGGGHADYGGNEVYAFRLDTLKWVRLTNPSPTTQDTVDALADGRPASRHTYSGLAYLPVQDRMFAAGGSLWFGGSGTNGAWTFDPAAGTWHRRASMPGSQLTAMIAYDARTGLVYSLQQDGDLVAYNPATDTWRKRGSAGGWAGFDPARTMVVHPTQRKLLVIGGGAVMQFDLTHTSMSLQTIATTGGAAIVNAQGPGLVYDPVIDKIVGWAGGGDVYPLDLDTRAWTRRPAAGSVVPTAPPHQGTYGRFQYIPSANLYITVNAIDQNVFLYRLSAGGAPPSTPAPSPPPPPGKGLTLPLGTWVARALPAFGKGPAPAGFGAKHSRLLHDSTRGRMVLTGGDYRNPFGPEDGNTQVWAIDLAQGDTWTLLSPWCVASGSLMPGFPDNVVWVYDSRRDRGVMMPGFYFITQGDTRCPGTIESADSVLFDFATSRWLAPSYPPPPGGYGGDLGSTFGVYDPTSDAVLRFRWDGGWGNVMEVLSLATNTWEVVRLGSGDDLIRNTNAHSDQSAIDVQGRSVYVISRQLRALLRYSIPRKRVVQTIPLPTQGQWHLLAGDFETWMTFDPISRVLLIPALHPSILGDGYDGRMEALAIYHVDTGQWEWEPIPGPVGGHTVRGNVLGFDATHSALMLIGGKSNPTVFWLYRYGR